MRLFLCDSHTFLCSSFSILSLCSLLSYLSVPIERFIFASWLVHIITLSYTTHHADPHACFILGKQPNIRYKLIRESRLIIVWDTLKLALLVSYCAAVLFPSLKHRHTLKININAITMSLSFILLLLLLLLLLVVLLLIPLLLLPLLLLMILLLRFHLNTWAMSGCGIMRYFHQPSI